MSWYKIFEYEGMPFIIHSPLLWESGLDESVGLLLRDPATITAIRNRDSCIFDLLNQLIDDIDEISYASEAAMSGWFDMIEKKKGEAECRRIAAIVRDSDFASPEAQARAIQRLAWMDAGRPRAPREETPAVLAQRRRSQFDAKKKRLRPLLIERDGECCKLCGSTDDITFDHIIPVSKGGTDDLDNLRFLCRTCNTRKGPRPA